jgi:hypothetical protein
MSGTRPFPTTLGREHERELHAAVARYLGVAVRPPTTWTTFPAGGGGLERGRMLARLGLRPGWPDILVLHPAEERRVIVVGLELKTEIGRQSMAQRAVQEEFAAAGASYALCRSIIDVEQVLEAAGVPIFARVAKAREAA